MVSILPVAVSNAERVLGAFRFRFQVKTHVRVATKRHRHPESILHCGGLGSLLRRSWSVSFKLRCMSSDGDETRPLTVLRPTVISRVNPLMERCDSPVQSHDEEGIAIPTIGGGTSDLGERLKLRTEEAPAVAAGAGKRDAERSRVHWCKPFPVITGLERNSP